MYKSLLFSACILISNLCVADVSLGKPLPALDISSQGELVFHDSKFKYLPWDSSIFANQDSPRVHTIQYIAARISARALNEPFTDKLDEIRFPRDKHLITTIVNTKDAMWGTGGFVISELKSNKKKHQHASIVVDKKGLGAKKWALSPQSSAIIILSPEGEVLFFKDGALSAGELNEAINLIDQQIKILETKIVAAES